MLTHVAPAIEREPEASAQRSAAQIRRCVEPPRAVEVAPYCAGLPEARFVGDVPDLCDPIVWPAAASVGLAAFGRTAQAAAQVAPLYLRPSQAERMAGEKRR